jgi:hypothetical protein
MWRPAGTARFNATFLAEATPPLLYAWLLAVSSIRWTTGIVQPACAPAGRHPLWTWLT